MVSYTPNPWHGGGLYCEDLVLLLFRHLSFLHYSLVISCLERMCRSSCIALTQCGDGQDLAASIWTHLHWWEKCHVRLQLDM